MMRLRKSANKWEPSQKTDKSMLRNLKALHRLQKTSQISNKRPSYKTRTKKILNLNKSNLSIKLLHNKVFKEAHSQLNEKMLLLPQIKFLSRDSKMMNHCKEKRGSIMKTNLRSLSLLISISVKNLEKLLELSTPS